MIGMSQPQPRSPKTSRRREGLGKGGVGIRDPEALCKAIKREVEARKLEEVKRKVSELHEVLEKIDIEEFVKLIREDREKR